jgi:hypothetical protein
MLISASECLYRNLNIAFVLNAFANKQKLHQPMRVARGVAKNIAQPWQLQHLLPFCTLSEIP